MVIGVTATPFKCPPAPSETALLVHKYLSGRGLRDRCEMALAMPYPDPVLPVPAASKALLRALEERGIRWHPGRVIEWLETNMKELVSTDGTTMDFDLFLGVPRHVDPSVVVASGRSVAGWIPVNPLTLETAYPNVIAE